MPSVNHNVINLLAGLSIRRPPSGFVDIEMLESGATDYPEIDQPHAVGRSCRVEAEQSDSGTKDSFLLDHHVENPEDNLDVMGILDRIVLLFLGVCAQIRLIVWNFVLMRISASVLFTEV